jgi:hypothetical protein
MIKRVILGITLLLSMGHSNQREQARDSKEFNNFKKISLNKKYINSLSSPNLVDTYILENSNNQKVFKFSLKNLGEKSRHPQNCVKFKIEDANGNIIKFGELSALQGDTSFTFSPNGSGNIYIKFYSSKYEFTIT